MRHALPRRKLMKDRTSRNPDELPLILILLGGRIVCGPVPSVVVVLLDRIAHGEFIGLGDKRRRGASGKRHVAFLGRDDEVTEVSPVRAVETVFQSLKKGMNGAKACERPRVVTLAHVQKSMNTIITSANMRVAHAPCTNRIS
jgi:hypothetical protein